MARAEWKEVGIQEDPPALVIFYSDGSGMNKLVIPLRRAHELGVEASAKQLIESLSQREESEAKRLPMASPSAIR